MGFSQSDMIKAFKRMNGGKISESDSLRIINGFKANADTEIVMVEGNNQHSAKAMVVDANEAKKYYGYNIVVEDKIYGGKVIKGSGRTFIFIGGKYPDQKMTVSIKTEDLTVPAQNLKNYKISVSGKIIGNKEQPYIFVKDSNRYLKTSSDTLIIYNGMTPPTMIENKE